MTPVKLSVMFPVYWLIYSNQMADSSCKSNSINKTGRDCCGPLASLATRGFVELGTITLNDAAEKNTINIRWGHIRLVGKKESERVSSCPGEWELNGLLALLSSPHQLFCLIRHSLMTTAFLRRGVSTWFSGHCSMSAGRVSLTVLIWINWSQDLIFCYIPHH